MDKSRHQGFPTTTEDLRNICRHVAPYVCRQWRDLCEELGVADITLNNIQTDGRKGAVIPELAYKGMCAWLDMVGRTASVDKLVRATRVCGLRRAEDYLQNLGARRTVPCLARPSSVCEPQQNKQARQKATLDRLSRPKTVAVTEKPSKKPASLNKPNLINLQMPLSKPNEICEVKIRITVQGVQRDAEMESTRDDFQSTKQDSKQICHTFVKLVMADQKPHFAKLKELLGFDGISVQRLDKVGFNINIYMLCFTLGAFETLHQIYRTGRLKHIIQNCLVRPAYLKKIQARALEVSVQIDDMMVNKYREILMARATAAGESRQTSHPIDLIDDPDRESGDPEKSYISIRPDFDLESFIEQLDDDITILRQRYDVFTTTANEFLRTLRILRPHNCGSIKCFQEILDIFFNLRNSNSAVHVQKSELEEFIAIVNQIRLKSVFIHNNDAGISFEESISLEANDRFHKRLFNLDEMLEPSYKFSANSNKIKETYSGIEHEQYSGVLSHIPDLLTQLSLAVQTLKQNVEPEKEDEDKENDINVKNNDDKTDVPCKVDYQKPAVYDPDHMDSNISTQYLTMWTPPILVTFHD